MNSLYLQDAQVAARYGVSRATIWRWANISLAFPNSILLSASCTRWRLEDLEAWEQGASKPPLHRKRRTSRQPDPPDFSNSGQADIPRDCCDNALMPGRRKTKAYKMSSPNTSTAAKFPIDATTELIGNWL